MSKTKVFWLALGAPLHQRQHHGKPVTKKHENANLTTGIAYTRKRSALLNPSLCPLACLSFAMLGLSLIIGSFSINDGTGNDNAIN